MISRKHRFHGQSSIGRVYRGGQTVRSELMSLKYITSNREDYRLAVVVSKKVSKSAVVRNRIRRRIYEIIRIMRKNSEPWKYDLLLYVYDERIAEKPHDQLEKLLHKLLIDAKIINRSR